MRENSEIKRIGKEGFQRDYWTAVLVTLLPSVIVAGVTAITQGAGSIVGTIISGPLMVGMCYVLLKQVRGVKSSIGEMFNCAFDGNFGTKFGGMLLMDIFTFLWSLLFIVPGIIKAFSYAMTPYILAEYPKVSARESLRISQKLMNGYKGKLFLLGLSYIGWILLSILTFGILLMFYVAPWMECANAEFFNERIASGLAEGVVTPEELGIEGFEAAGQAAEEAEPVEAEVL